MLDGVAGDAFGASVSGAGDFDGDGLPELIVGAPTAGPSDRTEAGSAFVFGSGPVDVFTDGFDSGDTSAWSSAVP